MVQIHILNGVYFKGIQMVQILLITWLIKNAVGIPEVIVVNEDGNPMIVNG